MYLHNKKISRIETVALLFFAVFLCYANALFLGKYQFDDFNVIVNNPVIHSWHAWWSNVGYGIRPLLKLSYTIDWAIGWGEYGFHFTNLLIHFANALLVWFLTASILRLLSVVTHDATLISSVVALLFAVSPIHTEAVTYISGRSASLMSLFYLGAVLSYMTGLKNENRFYLQVLTPVLFCAALAVKEIAITLPLALLLIHSLKGDNWRVSVVCAWPSWVVFIAAVIFFLQDTYYSSHLAQCFASNVGLSNLIIQTNAVIYLLGQWICPLWLNIDPDLSDFNTISKLKIILISAFFILYLIFIKKLNKRPWLTFAFGWVVIQLFLIYLITPRLDIANERQLYLVSWPLLMVLVIEMNIFLNARQFIFWIFILLLAESSITVIRNLDYRSEVALWQATVKLSPNKSRVHNNLGYAYFMNGQPEKARQYYLNALRLDNQNFKATYNLNALDK